MSKIIGVDTSIIDNISGLGTGGGGIPAVPATTDTGVVLCVQNSSLRGPYSAATFGDYSNPAHMFQVSELTGVVEMDASYNAWGVLLSNGNLYIGSHQNAPYMGVSQTDALDAINNGGLVLSFTNVSKFGFLPNGIMAIKNGGLYWAGSTSGVLDSTGTGQGTTNAFYEWKQIGTDTDWYDFASFSGYPYQVIAIKGASGSRYLYATGYNTNYGTGQGTNSGTLNSFTRVKSAASTDLSESFSKVAISYSSALAVTDSGKLFSWGENAYGPLGTGDTTDKQYATQVGTDTDWSNCWVQRYGGFAMKTDGTMYMSTSRGQWRIEPSTSSTFTQIGTDTDYEDLVLAKNTTSNFGYIVFAKKGGSWYVSSNPVGGGGWVGASYWSGSSEGTWVTVNDALTENDITGTIDAVHVFESNSNFGQTQIFFALS